MKRFDDRKLKPKLTPMMQQWQKIKKQYPDYIIFFRAGDFYECFNEDAKVASEILNITLTARTVGERKFPLAGVPYHAVDAYIAKMVQSGKKVAIVEQLEDPKLAKTIVKRGVVQLITRGTITLPESLGKGINNYLVAINKEQEIYGLSALDLSTGEFLVSDFQGVNAINLLEVELTRLKPTEILVERELWKNLGIYFDEEKVSFTYREDYYFDTNQGKEILCQHFGVLSLEGFGINNYSPSIGSAGAILSYIKETQLRDSFLNISKISPITSHDYMVLDYSTVRNLELIENLRDRTNYGTLRQIIDNTTTSAGSRLLTTWLLRPSLKLSVIESRLASTEEMFEESILRDEIRDVLRKMNDLERLISRVCLGRSKPRDLVALRFSLELIPNIKNILSKVKTPLLKEIKDNLNPLKEAVKIISVGIKDEVPNNIKDGNVIREGYNEELDELRKIQKGGKSFLTSLEAREKVKTGIKTLKVKYNKVFGYFIEIPKSASEDVPPEYDRKQTLVNAERFITPELKEYEEKILNAEEKILLLEEQLFNEILEKISKYATEIQSNAYNCAILDVITTFAQNAVYYNYTKPSITNDDILEIKAGRHPVVEQLLDKTTFIPNDTILKRDSERILIITGPNMCGKCVRPDTLIFTNKGILPIEHFKPNNIKDGEFNDLKISLISNDGIKETSHFYSDGKKDTLQITTRRGFVIEGTYNHPILVRAKDGSEKWKKLSDVTIDDYAIINRNNDLWGEETGLYYEMKKYPYQVRKHPLPDSLSHDLAYLMGLLIGDGTLTYDSSFYLSTGDSFLSSEFTNLIKRLFNYDVKIKKNNKDHCVSSKYIRDFLFLVGLDFVRAHEKEIPDVILKAPKEFVTSFLQGLFDTDGTAEKHYGKVSLSTTSRKLATQTQIILLNYGLLSSLKVKKTKSRPCYEVRLTGLDAIEFYNKINFKLPRKRERLTYASNIRMTNIDSIPYLDEILLTIKGRYLDRSKKIQSENKLKYNKKISGVYDSYIRQGRNISYLKLNELIEYFNKNMIDCNELEQIAHNHFFYDKIQQIEKSESEVYDFTVPEAHSFIGNGFINHNSTNLRQVALIVLMAQVGSFVPAHSAKIGLTDRIFTRIGAHDVIVENRSTFMVEMYECANILNNATERSLVILDEVGRGTSTYDGVAIAWSITEYLHNNIGKAGPRTLFATHYHELIELEDLLPRVKNYHASVKNVNGEVHFLYKIKEGGISESFGVHVASLAGLPKKVIENADEMLSILHKKGTNESEVQAQKITPNSSQKPSIESSTKEQLELVEEISNVKIETITPIEAFNLLNQLVEKSKKYLKRKNK